MGLGFSVSVWALLAITIGLANADVPGSLIGEHSQPIHSLAVAPNELLVASGDAYAEKPGTLIIWDLVSRKALHTLQGHKDGILAVAFSPDSELLASGSADGTIKFWATQTGKLLGSMDKVGGGLIKLHFVDKRSLAIQTPAELPMFYDLTDLKSPLLKDHVFKAKWPCHITAYSSDGRVLAVGSNPSDPPDDRAVGSVELFEVKTGKQVTWVPGSDAEIRSLAIDPLAQRLATGKTDHTIDLWFLKEKRRVLLRAHEEQVVALAFADKGNLLASASYNGVIMIWDTSKKDAKVAKIVGHDGAVFGLAFTADGKTLISGGFDRKLKAWDCSKLDQD
jgi:WD40 repeat protein